MARITIPFGSGVREDVDPLVMPQGGLKRVENLRLTKEGRLALRKGYTSLGVTSFTDGTGNTTFVPTDLMAYGDRLLAAGCITGGTVPEDLYEYAALSLRKWRPTDNEGETRLNPVTGVRNVGRVPSQSASVTVCDVAATNGAACLVWQDGSDTNVHVFDPATDTTIIVNTIPNMSAPRVIGSDGVFYIFGIVGTAVVRASFDRTVNSQVSSTSTIIASTGAAISCMDASLSEDGGMVVAAARNATPAVTIRRLNSAAITLQTITGPAVTLNSLAVFGQAARVHLVAVETADSHVDLYTYEVAGGTLENTTLNLASGVATGRQPGICLTGTLADLLITFQHTTNRTVYQVRLDPSTHGTFTDRQWDGIQLQSKPVKTTATEAFGGTFADSSSATTNFVGIVGRARSTATEMVAAVTDKGVAVITAASALPHIAKDTSTGKYYRVRLVDDPDGRTFPVVSELLINDTGRRQTATIDNSLYIASGAPQIFGGRQLVEAGFLNRPRIVSATASNSTGSLTSNTLYTLAVTFEWYDEQARFHTSEPSDVVEVTMNGTDDAIAVVVVGPLSLRCNATNQAYGGAVKVVIWRSLAAPDKQLHRDATTTITPGTFGASVTINLTQSDVALEDEAIIYTQGASGARSGPNPFVSPQPCRYLYPSGDKITSGGLPQDSQIQESRSAFPNEPITWAENLGGLSSAPERVLEVARLDERRIAWTARAIFEWGGEGLDINGVGDLGFARRLPSPGGLYGGADGWRSIVETAVGIFFQLAADSIYLLPRGGGAPVFIGKPVQDTLASYPVITSATYLKTEQLVCFTCNDSGATDSVILVHDLESQQWFVDTDTTALLAACEYQGRLVILRSNNTIEQQDAAHPPSSFLTALIETGTLYPAGQGGDMQLDEIQLFAEYRGPCNVVLSLSYDDGQTYPVSLTKALTGLTVGSSVTLKWGPNNMRGDRVRLKFHTTDLSGASEQLAFQFATVDFTAHGRSALRATTQKG
jgi:hypothetical protein